MKLIWVFLFLTLTMTVLACGHDGLDSHPLPRPLIIQYPEMVEFQSNKAGSDEEELRLECTSWRFAAETNNLSPWDTVPIECGEYVKEYMEGRGYGFDLERVSKEAGSFAKNFKLNEDGKDAWIFDIDETLLSNLPYYEEHGYGLEIFDRVEFNKWVEKGMAPAIKPSLILYEEVLKVGFRVFLLTGRSESYMDATVENLKRVGFQDWDMIILRGREDHMKHATAFKSEKREEMVRDGFRIVGNSGDQWSDLLGSSMSIRSFKLPNPMYFIP
ncbi:acid phosphatase 1 [Impatiens glandulifera]|uniref:acid phosphatase 1 n=1 Tax=Impatiens glandulifera TaxID=253017 RepID=UPI001FB122A7|nr:acid phosphatase 1 [Impatiens glandulifera]